MYCSSTPSSFVKERFALKPLTNPGVKLFCVQANCPTSCIDTGSCHKCLCFLEFQLKVSTLYIVQIKRKCGIELREHYNKSKKEKQIIPQCTPEKEEAIMDALRHFKMI